MDKCYECKFACITGGDSVPYGSGYARLPEYFEECDAPEVISLNVTEYEEFIEKDHSDCPYFKEK
jgi:hypothetical protein